MTKTPDEIKALEMLTGGSYWVVGNSITLPSDRRTDKPATWLDADTMEPLAPGELKKRIASYVYGDQDMPCQSKDRTIDIVYDMVQKP